MTVCSDCKSGDHDNCDGIVEIANGFVFCSCEEFPHPNRLID